MSDTEVIVAADEWRTFRRVLPRDVHELLKSFEADVARELGTSGEGLGGSVAIWTVISRFLDIHREELQELAREFVEEN